MKQQRKRKKRILWVLVLIILACSLHVYIARMKENPNTNHANNAYQVIKKDKNEWYRGIGQEEVDGQDGYFTTFTTTDKKVYKEYKQNGSSSWAQKGYWGGTMDENGCGITAISIILSGYGKQSTPENLRKKYAPVLKGEDISKELTKTFHIENSDFYYDAKHLSKEYIEEHLKSNRPVLLCLWNKPTNNRWTNTSHYLVLLATDGKGMVYVSNPNGLEKDSKSSGWYPIEEIEPYIAKALFIEEK